MRTTVRYLALLATIASTSTFALAQDDATQAGRRQADQSPLSTQGQAQGRTGAQAGRARGAGEQAGQEGHAAANAASQGAGMTVAQFLAHDLRRGNEAEVELGKLASEKAEHDQVKKFAQMMVEHHQPMIEQLQQMEQRAGAAGQGGGAGQSGTRQRVGQSEPGARDQSNDRAIQDQASPQGNTRRGTGNVRNSESGTDGERQPQGARAPGGTSQASSVAGQAPGTNEPGTPPTVAGQATPGQAGIAGGAATMMGSHVPQQLTAVLDQACDTELQMTREMLQSHQGQDFDMGYIGQQIIAHTCMLAKLQAVRNSGPQELQQLAMQAEQTTRQHLDMAKQIADQLKDRDSSGAAPTRSANSPSSTERETK